MVAKTRACSQCAENSENNSLSDFMGPPQVDLADWEAALSLPGRNPKLPCAFDHTHRPAMTNNSNSLSRLLNAFAMDTRWSVVVVAVFAVAATIVLFVVVASGPKTGPGGDSKPYWLVGEEPSSV